MVVQHSDVQLLYGLLYSVCGWAFERGFRDVPKLKELTRVAMVDVAGKQYIGKPKSMAQSGISADLDLSIRNVQRAQKLREKLGKYQLELAKISEIQTEIHIRLNVNPMTLDDLIGELSYKMLFPYSMQKSFMKEILNDMVRKNKN